MTAPSPLPLAHPVLAVLREAGNWWQLQQVLATAAIDPTDASVALTTAAENDRAFQDEVSAETRTWFLDRLQASLRDGPAAAFTEYSSAARDDAPGWLYPHLERVDRSVHAFLTAADPAELLAAEQAWIEAVGTGQIDTLPPALRLSLLCDAATLHEIAWLITGDPQRLDNLVGVLDITVAGFRDFTGFAAAGRLDLDPRLPTVVGRLAAALRNRFVAGGVPDDLNRAGAMAVAAASLVAPGSPDSARWRMEAGVIASLARPDDPAEARSVFASVADSEPAGSPLRLRAFDFTARLARQHDSLDEAVAAWTRAWDEPGGRTREIGESLTEALLARGADGDVGAAAQVLSGVALSGSDPDDPRTPAQQLCDALAQLITTSGSQVVSVGIDALGGLKDDAAAEEVAEGLAQFSGVLAGPAAQLPWALDRRIELLVAAIDIAEGSPLEIDRRNDLSVALDERFTRAGDEGDLRAAIEIVRPTKPLSATDPGRVAAANTFGALLMRRFDLVGDLGDLDVAIACLDAVVDAAGGLSPAERAGMTGNLATALRTRAGRGGSPADLDRAGEVAADALAQVADGPPDALTGARAVSASVHYDRWLAGGQVGDLADAIADWTAVLPDASPAGVAYTQYNLGNARLSALAAVTAEPADADVAEVIDLLRRAIVALPPSTPERALAANRLADAFSRQADASGEPRLARRALRWGARARRWAAATSAEMSLRVCWDDGRRAEHHDSWETAAESYRGALEAMLDLVAASAFLGHQDTWLALGYGVPTRAAYALLQCGRPDDAVVALEAGRGRLLSDAIGALDDQVAVADGSESAEYAQYRAANVRWRDLAARGGDPEEVDRVRALAIEARAALLAALGATDLVAAPTFAAVSAALTEPLAYLVPGTRDGSAIVLAPGAPARVIPLPGLDEATLGRRVRDFRAAATDGSPHAWQRGLERVTEWLGEVLAPVRAAVSGPRVTLVPTGALAFLPLHAAWQQTGAGRTTWLDDCVISYAPTASALAAGRRRAAPAPSAPTPSAPTQGSVLAVADPTPSELPTLADAAAEAAMAVRDGDPADVLSGPTATRDEVRARLRGARRLHFAGHGLAYPGRPRASGLVLSGDDLLTIDDLARIELTETRLAFLSDCQTGLPGAGAPDELLDLGATLFGAGVDAVISSLWSVPDSSTLLLAVRFYELLADDPAAALAAAQRWIRDTTNAAKLAHWRAEHESGRLPAVTFTAIEQILSDLPPERLDFAGADHWAAFCCTGF